MHGLNVYFTPQFSFSSVDIAKANRQKTSQDSGRAGVDFYHGHQFKDSLKVAMEVKRSEPNHPTTVGALSDAERLIIMRQCSGMLLGSPPDIDKDYLNNLLTRLSPSDNLLHHYTRVLNFFTRLK